MTNRLAYCTPDALLPEVAGMMVNCDCGAIPVIDPASNKALGIVTDRDILCRAVAACQNPSAIRADQVMTTPIAAVTPESSLEDCLAKMEAAQVRRMLVIDKAEALCGVVSQADIVRAVPERQAATLVRDVSAPNTHASRVH